MMDEKGADNYIFSGIILGSARYSRCFWSSLISSHYESYAGLFSRFLGIWKDYRDSESFVFNRGKNLALRVAYVVIF